MEGILHQLIGTLSHYLQGFIHPFGGWEWDFWTINSSMGVFFPDFASRRQVQRLLAMDTYNDAMIERRIHPSFFGYTR